MPHNSVHFKNMLPPEEVLPNGRCASKTLLEDLCGRFEKSTGEIIVFDFPRRSDADGRCMLKPQRHPRCRAVSCPSGTECRQLWKHHLELAIGSHAIAQWQCPGGNTAFVGSVCINGTLIYFGKVVLRSRLETTHTALIKNTVHSTLREMELTIENRILKQQLKNSPTGGFRPAQAEIQTDHPAVGHAIEYITEHYRNSSLSLTGVAETVGLSPCHLSTLFHNATGTTFHDYIKNLRLNNAQNLINATNLPLPEIARRSGFATPRNLRRALNQSEKNR